VLGLAIVGIAVAVSFFAPWGKTAPVVSTRPTSIDRGLGASREPAAATDNFGASLSDEGAWVHVVGEVRSPGLYLVALGSRVVDAVMAAGGLTDAADECAINLARPVSDGEQLVISTRVGEPMGCGVLPAAGGNGGGSSAPISLSRADVVTLDSLPGIGPTLAQRIIDWRTANGGFTSVDQLNDVSGIGDKLFATLRPLVTP
jgi:competence protein ComEA